MPRAAGDEGEKYKRNKREARVPETVAAKERPVVAEKPSNAGEAKGVPNPEMGTG
jgi:hypothetical protein